ASCRRRAEAVRGRVHSAQGGQTRHTAAREAAAAMIGASTMKTATAVNASAAKAAAATVAAAATMSAATTPAMSAAAAMSKGESSAAQCDDCEQNPTKPPRMRAHTTPF